MSKSNVSGPINVGVGYSGDVTPEVRLASGTPGQEVTRIKFKGVANTANADVVTVQNAAYGQATTLTIPDPGVAAASFVLNPYPAGIVPDMLIRKNITAGQAALAAAGTVVVQAHTSATSQFEIVDVRVCKSTGLSGNAGDRLLALTDGTIVFNNTGITAAVLGTPVNTVWGGTGNPLPGGTVGFNTPSTAGADIVLQYTGGTADYNAGSVVIQVALRQVTA